MFDAAEEASAHHVFTRLHPQRRSAANIDRLLVHAPCPKRQPAESALKHAHAQVRKTVEETGSDECGNEPHRAPRMSGEPPKEDVVIEIAIAGIVRWRPGKAVIGNREVVFL